MEKTTVAVFFGGNSFEHDVGILTGLGACRSFDREKFTVIPIYMDLKNQMWSGDRLFQWKTYPLEGAKKRLVSEARLMVGEEKPTLLITERRLFMKKTRKINFDAALLAAVGGAGEGGHLQGLCEMAGIPYTGCRALPSGIAMNKILAKKVAKSVGVPTLDDFVIRRPRDEFFDIKDAAKDLPFKFPIIIKPTSLGSSVGVAKVNNSEELNMAILRVFGLGDDAMAEPFVENLEEYNISVTRAFTGEISTSVIERPDKKKSDILGFNEKYLSGDEGKIGGGKLGWKFGGEKLPNYGEGRSEYFSQTHRIDPEELTVEQKENIVKWATDIFEALDCSGVARIDFLRNSKTKEFYFCEINTIPGSLAFYLWEASDNFYSYTDLLTALVEEALKLHREKKSDISLTASGSAIFREK
ncbi:MAG: hypothetical protein LBB09_01935 [Rickettsiales bacterium]|jgi:D-alanine-D-alanine ligase|nr:hypothetical protein [Rickettsiales bacterium]